MFQCQEIDLIHYCINGEWVCRILATDTSGVKLPYLPFHCVEAAKRYCEKKRWIIRDEIIFS